MKKHLLLIAAVGFASAAFAAKYTTQTERPTVVHANINWIEGQVAPTRVFIEADVSTKIVNDADATDERELKRESIRFDSLRDERSITIGAQTLTYRQATLFYLKMIADARSNPPAPLP